MKASRTITSKITRLPLVYIAIGVLCGTLLLQSHVEAYDVNSYTIHNYTHVSGGRSVTSSPINQISGDIPSQCSDVAIGISKNGNPFRYFFSESGQVSLYDSMNKSWWLDLNAQGFPLQESGVYDIYVASKCGRSSYNTPLYSDLHGSAVLIVPDYCDDDCIPIYRMYDLYKNVHFYTTSENERNNLLGMSGAYRVEGVAGYAQSYNDPSLNTVPVHRFYNYIKGVHFYTSNQAEASNVNDTMSSTYRYEGVSYNVIKP